MFVLYNYYREHWLIYRISQTLEKVFNQPVLVNPLGLNAKAATFFVGPAAKSNKIDYAIILEKQSELATPVDDWPFVYLKAKSIPIFYIKFLAVIAIISFFSILIAIKANKVVLDFRMFFLGAGFMLLETKNLVTYAVLFGNTWFVNSLVFISILLMVFFANALILKLKLKTIFPIYFALFLALLIAYIIPVSTLLSLGKIERFIVAGLLYFSPVFFANIIFATSFKSSSNPQISFASNILGALSGGLLEYVSLMTGYNFLLLLIAFFYSLSLFKIKNGSQ